jgi:imidazolonepropionase-like amidohydrolase
MAGTGPRDSRQAIRAGGAFDGRVMIGGGALVLCADGAITGVLPAGAPAPDGWPVADFPGATVLPGMIDCHVHLCGDSRDGALERLSFYTDDELGAVIEASLRAQLAAGVTAVRDLGDRRGAVLRWRERARELGLPAIVASGPPITSPRGHCWYMGGEASGHSALRAAVRDRAERGADVVKVMASGGMLTPGTDVLGCQYTAGELRTVVDEAHALGLPVTAHAHALPAVRQAADAGADGIEHCSCLTDNGIDVPGELLERLAAARVTVCPTLGRGEHPGPPPPGLAELLRRTGLTYESRLDAVRKLHEAGVVIASGVDAGIGPGKPHGFLGVAVADLAAAGIPAGVALASATSVAADAIGLGGRKGLLRDGYDADLTVVGGDPVADIGALSDVRAVYIAGTRVA